LPIRIDPLWRTRHEAAEAFLTRAEIARAQAAGLEFGGKAHQAAAEVCALARAAMEEAWGARFLTIESYAGWRLSTLPEAPDGFAVVHDFAAFTSRAEVDAVFARAKTDLEQGMAAQKFLLRVGQPPGLKAFFPAFEVVRTLRHFGPVEVSVSFHETGGTYHVCLSHRWGELPGANETFRKIASQLMRESLEVMLPESVILFTAGPQQFLEHRELLRQANALVSKFYFYRHLLHGSRQKEEFKRVEMGWAGNCFIDPDWDSYVYPCLPEGLREAGFGLPLLPGR